jgi:hypothetical protein
MINVAYIQTPNSGSILLGNSKSKITKVQLGDSLLIEEEFRSQNSEVRIQNKSVGDSDRAGIVRACVS